MVSRGSELGWVVRTSGPISSAVFVAGVAKRCGRAEPKGAGEPLGVEAPGTFSVAAAGLPWLVASRMPRLVVDGCLVAGRKPWLVIHGAALPYEPAVVPPRRIAARCDVVRWRPSPIAAPGTSSETSGARARGDRSAKGERARGPLLTAARGSMPGGLGDGGPVGRTAGMSVAAQSLSVTAQPPDRAPSRAEVAGAPAPATIHRSAGSSPATASRRSRMAARARLNS